MCDRRSKCAPHEQSSSLARTAATLRVSCIITHETYPYSDSSTAFDRKQERIGNHSYLVNCRIQLVPPTESAALAAAARNLRGDVVPILWAILFHEPSELLVVVFLPRPSLFRVY